MVYRYIEPESIGVTEIREKDEGFYVGSADASRILGMPRSTLFRYDGPDIERETVTRGSVTQEIRNFSDEALLRIAKVTGNAKISLDSEFV